MSNPTIRLRTTLLRLTIILSCWLRAYNSVLAANVFVDDASPMIVYLPQSSWLPSTESCTSCLNPEGTTSYHEAIHLGIAPDTDDHPTVPAGQSPSSSASSSSTAPSPNLAAAAPTSKPTSKAASTTSSAKATSTAPGGEDKGGSPTPNSGPGSANSGSGSSGSGTSSTPGSSGKSRRSILGRGANRRLDPDDAGFQDPDVTLSFNFTGSAVYVYCIQPLGPPSAATNNTPTNMNLTFTLDGETMGDSDFKSTPSSPSPAYRSNQTVFSKSNLEEAPHELVVHVGQNSTFIFDYLVYSTNSTANSTATPLAAQTTPSPTVDPSVKKHNIATFAGAVGGSVGVLAIFSLGLAISIIRRRRLAARRDRLDAESLHTNGSDDSPHMSGPAPFVPRFFPDTVIPPDPPTYMAATNHNSSTLLASLSSSAYPASTLSYADVPPSSPPPPLEDAALMPPPPFPLALSIRPVLPVGAMPPSMSEANLASHNLDSSVESDPARSQSRASSRSISYDIHGNPITNPDEEDLR